MTSKYKLMIKGFAMLGIVGLLSSCGGSADLAPPDPNCDLQCSVPPAGKFCIAGQLRDTENNDPIPGENSVEITFYEASSFVSGPNITPPLSIDTITMNSCGQFLAQGITTPVTGFVVIKTDDITGVDDYLPTGALYPVTPNSQVDNINLFATRYTTDNQWTSSASDPFGGLLFYEEGAAALIFMHLDVPVGGVTITVNNTLQTADDFYFSDSTFNSRTAIDTNLTATGINGTGIITKSFLVNHSGTGSEPAGCEWPSNLSASIPGVLMVQEVNAVQTGTNVACQ
jgi:hypothetical protein